jgi:hypothetical protein
LDLLPEISGTDRPEVIEHPDKAIEAAPKPIIFRKLRRFTWPIICILNVIAVLHSILRILDKIGDAREKVK